MYIVQCAHTALLNILNPLIHKHFLLSVQSYNVQSYNPSQVHQWLRSTHLVNTNTHSLNGLSEAHFLNPLTEIQFAMTRFLHGQEIRPGKPLPTPRNFLLKAIYCALHHIIFSLIAFYYFFGPSVAFLSSLLGHTAQQTSLAPEQLLKKKKNSNYVSRWQATLLNRVKRCS